MLEAREYVDIRFQDEVRYKKPVGIYWLQAAAVKAGEALGVPQARTTIWLYRLPSLAGATFAVLLTYWAALAFVARRAALVAAMMMASSVLLGVEARLAKTDAMLLLTAVAAMGALARIYLTSRRTPETRIGWREPAILWTALAGGVLLKGPLILMFVVLTALTLSIADRSGRWVWSLRPFAGLVWLVLLVLPWFIAIIAKSGTSFFAEAIGHDMLDKVTSGQEAHGAPPGLYLVLFWITFWPGSLLTGLAAPAVWAVAARARCPVSARVAHSVVDHFRSGDDQAAALRAAAISRHRHSDRGHPRCRRLVENAVDRARNNRVVSFSQRGRAGRAGCFIMVGGDLGLIAWPSAAVALIFGLFAWWLYDVDGPNARCCAPCWRPSSSRSPSTR